MANRISQIVAEVFAVGSPKANVSQIVAEVFLKIDSTSALTVLVSDSNNSWSDSASVFLDSFAPPTQTSQADSFEVAEGNVEAFVGIPIAAEGSYSFTETVQTDFLIYTEPINVSFADSFELRELENAFAFDPYNIDFYEAFLLEEEVLAAETLTLTSADTLDSATDSVEIFAVGVQEAYDTLQYFFTEEVIVTMEQAASVSDALSLTDDASISNLDFVKNTSNSDTLQDWLEATETRLLSGLSFSDNITYGDAFSVFMNLGVVSVDNLVEDPAVFSESLSSLVTSFGTLSDSLSYDDAVSVATGTQIVVALTASASDSFTMTDSLVVRKPFQMTDYLRRYLNDVER